MTNEGNPDAGSQWRATPPSRDRRSRTSVERGASVEQPLRENGRILDAYFARGAIDSVFAVFAAAACRRR